MPLKVQELLEDVDQATSLQVNYETRRHPENQNTTLGLVPIQKVESREPVAKYFDSSDLSLNWMMLEQQLSKSVPRWVRLDIGRNIDDLCQSRIPQFKMQRGNMDVRSCGTTRHLRGVVLIYGTCEMTREGAQETTILQLNPGLIITSNFARPCVRVNMNEVFFTS